MPAKNHETDTAIVRAARQEFLQYGYNGASLRRIAEKAGTTTGSLYMRYKNKDALFCSLTACVQQDAEEAFRQLEAVYGNVKSAGDLTRAARLESEKIIDVIFRNYDAAVLLLCKSEGSSAADFFERISQRKKKESEDFFSRFPHSADQQHAFDILLTVQFDMYRQILKNGYTKNEAESCMTLLMDFMNSGWEKVLSSFFRF